MSMSLLERFLNIIARSNPERKEYFVVTLTCKSCGASQSQETYTPRSSKQINIPRELVEMARRHHSDTKGTGSLQLFGGGQYADSNHNIFVVSSKREPGFGEMEIITEPELLIFDQNGNYTSS